MAEILIVFGHSSDKEISGDGIVILKKLGIGFSLRIASAHRSPEFLEKIVAEFLAQDGRLFICAAGKSAHLAGVVASLTTKPVLAVPVYSDPTAGFDALLSMSQMPAGIPVGTLGFGKSGFTNACLLGAQILALSDEKLSLKLSSHRAEQASKVEQDDNSHRMDWTPGS